MRYDLTTDLALARGSGPRLRGHSGVLFAGSARWLTEPLDRELRDYVERGGRVASFGTDAFRRTVRVARAGSPTRARARARTSSARRPPRRPRRPRRSSSTRTRSACSPDSDGFVGLFTSFEQQDGLVSGARVLTAAGRDPERPAFVAYRLGRGTVIRVGTPQWASAIPSDPEVAAVTEATWNLLSR